MLEFMFGMTCICSADGNAALPTPFLTICIVHRVNDITLEVFLERATSALLDSKQYFMELTIPAYVGGISGV